MRNWIFIALLGLAAFASALVVKRDLPVEILRGRYADATSQFVVLDGMNVHYRAEGEGERTLVLLHGSGSSLHTWDGWAAALRDSMRVVRLDLPGAGLTGPRAESDYRISVDVDFVGRFLDELGVESAVIGGNSTGGHVAWHMALVRPDRVEALVLVSPTGAPDGGSGLAASRWVRVPVVSRALEVMTPRGMVERHLEALYGDPTLLMPETVDRYHDLIRRKGNRKAQIARTRAREESRFEELSRLGMPVLLMWGERDRRIPVRVAGVFQEMLPQARLVVYPQAGHVAMEEIPIETAAEVRRFVLDR
jgi:pimeloyl-ACP methyl ester carboxylesterase